MFQERTLDSFYLARNISLFVVLGLLVPALLLAGCTNLLRGTPQALFTCSHSSCYPYQQVEFDASGCISEKDEIVEYSWNFGDGASASGTKVQHTFTTPSDYAVCLTITTEHGQEASVMHTVHVAEALLVPAVYKTIQAAIDAAKDGDVVVVLPGTYNENLRFRGENITVQSSDPDDVGTVSATIIRGKEYGRPTVNFGEGSRSTLAG
ncbi:PKD domain-containing protein, partial [Candidatus Bipolaricaulota bacterium]|nr:PKD domain-containing protein [Candidatus Bipolaricaulota bacterium]